MKLWAANSWLQESLTNHPNRPTAQRIGDGRIDGTGAYAKTLSGPVANRGAVYTVAGCSGQGQGGGSFNHPAMFTSLNVFGSVVIDIHDNRLDALLLRETGAVDDHFAIIKGLPQIVSIAVKNNQIRLTWDSKPGELYRVERTSSLSPANWTVVGNMISGLENTTMWSEPVSSAGQAAFYRIAVSAPEAAE
jgi:hypothetical protein